jgi:hypothetical protein
MATLAELEARLAALKAQRDSALARVSYDGRSVEYRGSFEYGGSVFEEYRGRVGFVVQGAPDRRDPDRLVWTLDVRRS